MQKNGQFCYHQYIYFATLFASETWKIFCITETSIKGTLICHVCEIR